MEVKKSTLWAGLVIVIILLAMIFIVFGSSSNTNPTGEVIYEPVEGSTFSNTEDTIIRDSQGKPYVILFSTTWCSHCTWIKNTFDSLAEEPFASEINLQHWELDTGDNTISSEIETEIPADMRFIYKKYNPQGSIPTFVFGGKYIRIGNGYEQSGDLDAELEDFKLIINKLLEE